MAEDKKIYQQIEQDKKITQAHRARTPGNTKKAIPLYQKLAKSDSWLERLEGLNGLALCCRMEEDFQKAIEYFRQAIKLAKKHNFKTRIGGFYRDIAMTYHYLKDYRRSEKNFQKALSWLKKYSWNKPSNNPSYGITLTKLGYLFLEQREYQKAKKYLEQGLEILEKVDHEFWLMTTQLHLAELYISIDQPQKAVKLLEEAIRECKKSDSIYREIQCWLQMLKIKKGNRKIIERIRKLINKIDSSKIRTRFKKELAASTK